MRWILADRPKARARPRLWHVPIDQDRIADGITGTSPSRMAQMLEWLAAGELRPRKYQR